MKLIEQTAQKLYELTKDRPMFLHMDAIGFFHYGENIGNNIKEIIDNKLLLFNDALNLAQDLGANILIPTFSYSIENGKLNYDVISSPSEVGAATEFFRKLNPEKRTKDPIFSYLLFSNNEDLKEDLKVKDFNTFGENSIIDKVYKMNGFIGSIGNVMWHPTEAHYLEKKLNVDYRYDKKFIGIIQDIDNTNINIRTIFYCRNLNYNRIADFKPFEQYLYANYQLSMIKINDFKIEYIEFKKMFKLMLRKYKEDKLYFTKEDIKEYKINI